MTDPGFEPGEGAGVIEGGRKSLKALKK